MENRAEKAEKLNAFAINQFHNHFALKTERDAKQKYLNATECVKEIQNRYRPHRKYKRKDAGPDDEHTRIRITLLEYGNKGKTILPTHLKSDAGIKSNDTDANAGKSADDSAAILRNEQVCWLLNFKLWCFFIIFLVNFYFLCALHSNNFILIGFAD